MNNSLIKLTRKYALQNKLIRQRISKYVPRQSKRECNRRIKQLEKK